MSKPPTETNSPRIDLNLLNVFDAIMTERHVTRAGERLDMSQSAVSNALNRLRQQFQDQLFVKAARGVQPTPKALSLWPAIHRSLAELRDTVQPQEFDPSRADTQFRIASVDVTALLLGPHLHKIIHAQAPEVSMFFIPDDPQTNGPELMRGSIDFIIGIHPPRAAVLQSEPLWSEKYVVAARPDHPLMQSKVSLAAFCETPQIGINAAGDREAPNILDEALDNLGLRRNIALWVNQFSVMAPLLHGTDLIAALPGQLALPPYSGGLATCPLPFPSPTITVYLSWHRRSESIRAHQWFRQCILEATVRMKMQADEYR